MKTVFPSLRRLLPWLELKPDIKNAAAASATPANPSAILQLTDGIAAPVRRIATFHLNGLGDLLFTLPALAALREGFPGAHISTVLRPGLASLLEGSSLVDEILPRPRGGISSQAALMAKLASRHVDMAVSFSQSRLCVLLAFATRAPVRIGFSDAKMEALLTHRVPKSTDPYTIESHLDLVRALGCNPRQHDYTNLLNIPSEAYEQADQLLASNGVEGPFILAACEASERRGIKEWPAPYWATALNELGSRWPIVLAGTRHSEEVTSQMTRRVVDLGGRTELSVLAALCARASLFIGIDSGVLHLAAAMSTPVVGIYGPSSFELTGPRGVPHRIARHAVDCSPCFRSTCLWTGEEERMCLTRLEPLQVVRAARELIGV